MSPSSRKLSIAGKLRSFSIGLSRTFRYHEGLGSSYDTARRQLLAKMDDETYQSFVQSFRFCHECRQFVCNECWSTSRRSCLTCVAKSMTGTARPRPPFAPTGPEIPRPVVAAAAPTRRGRLRRDAALMALGLAIVLLVVEGGILLGAGGPGPTLPVIQGTEAPSETPTGTPSDTPVVTAVPSDTPTAPAPTPLPNPVISCPATASAGVAFACSWNNPWVGGATTTWFVVELSSDPVPGGSTLTTSIASAGTYAIQLHAVRGGTDDWTSTTITVNP